MPRQVAVLLAAALVLGATPAWAQAGKTNSAEQRALQLRDLAERAYALNLADNHADAEPGLREVVEGWAGATPRPRERPSFCGPGA